MLQYTVKISWLFPLSPGSYNQGKFRWEEKKNNSLMHLHKIVYDKCLYIFRTIFESTVNSKWFEVDYQQRNEDVSQWGGEIEKLQKMTR